MNTITVVTLGASAGGLTLDAMEAMKEAPRVILRTARTPVAAYLEERGIRFTSLDAFYENAEDFDSLNDALAGAVLEAAEQMPLVYAVLDAQWDESVRMITEKAPDAARVLPGVGMFDRLRQAHPDARMCAGDALPDALGDEPLLIVEIDSALLAGEIKLAMIDWFGADCPCVWYAPTENGEYAGKPIALQDLDRQRRYDHTAALYIAPPALREKERFTVQDLVRIMRVLRSPGGCPWDRAQTHESLRPYLIEEAYEVTQAIREEDWLHTADELGDVLLQVVFQANIGDQYGTLTLSDITTAICRKMIHRHPHIFSDVRADTADAVSENWEAIKRQERGQKELADVLSDIPASLPPLMRAQKALRKAGTAAPQDTDAARECILDALQGLMNGAGDDRDAHRLAGELLFACVDLARQRGVDCETALADAVDAFIKRACEKAEADKNI